MLAWAFFDGRLTSDKYCKIVDTELMNKARKEFRGQDWLLQQDGDPAHTANATKELLDVLGQHEGFEVLPWPSHSSDLNPVENVWDKLKEDISKLPYAHSLADLRGLVAQEIEHLNAPANHDFFTRLYDSMPKRVTAVIASHGYPIRY